MDRFNDQNLHVVLLGQVEQKNTKNIDFFERSQKVGAMEADKRGKVGTKKIRTVDAHHKFGQVG